MSRLLVSVRNAAEAEAALRGGAALIDVKEPANGPLGKADDDVIEEVLQAVAGRAPVSAALGELPSAMHCDTDRVLAGLSFVKVGLAGCRAELRQRQKFRALVAKRYPGALPVLAAYADWQQAGSPSVVEACEHARQETPGVFLIDTFAKNDGKNLLDRLTLSDLHELCRRCRSSQVRIALAGSLGRSEIAKLLALRPDWIAVRGAVCEGGRAGGVAEAKVRDLAAFLAATSPEN